ncbi:Gti1/Pac2 family-domain-containing protein [Xylogone sp. PMI_703]|nr:Gti1/Pac2 family-domain-containing protein [Xylogone sp. PMI_703]
MMDTYHGHVRTPADAIKLFEACRLGLLPRVQRRLSEKERQSIRSGSVFVWDEREAGMRRWTDGKSWSASRVSGSFLTYREMEGKRGGGNFVPNPQRRIAGKTPESGRGSDEDQEMDTDGPDGYRYKPDGLMKQSFSITTSTGQHLHLISYYSRPHPNSPDLPTPTTDPTLRHIIPVKGMYPESTVQEAQGPAVTRTPMQQSPYMPSPHAQLPGPVPPVARGPPQYQYQIPAGYQWPPSPATTPPFPHYYSNALPAPPAPHPYSPHHHQSALPPAPPQGQIPPSVYDRAPQGLPPPSSAPAPGMVAYPPQPSPRTAQARLISEQQAIAQRALQTGAMIDPRITSVPQNALPPVHAGDRHANTPPPSQTASRSPGRSPQMNGNGHISPPREPLSTPKMNGTSQAQSIPSISSLVHAQDSISVVPKNEPPTSAPASRAASPQNGNTTPSATSRDGRPTDIPHEKLNILGEDQRAIRVLDRKFCI